MPLPVAQIGRLILPGGQPLADASDSARRYCRLACQVHAREIEVLTQLMRLPLGADAQPVRLRALLLLLVREFPLGPSQGTLLSFHLSKVGGAADGANHEHKEQEGNRRKSNRQA